jgi:hypothetical protein
MLISQGDVKFKGAVEREAIMGIVAAYAAEYRTPTGKLRPNSSLQPR